MTTEQQQKMLEAAAKVCGLTYLVTGDACDPEHGNYYWNPLTNPGDCAEMCAKLGITWNNEYKTYVLCYGGSGAETALISDHNNSRLKAWMFAATMVAAKIGGYEE